MFAQLGLGFILLGAFLDCALWFVCHLEVVQEEERISRNVLAMIPSFPHCHIWPHCLLGYLFRICALKKQPQKPLRPPPLLFSGSQGQESVSLTWRLWGAFLCLQVPSASPPGDKDKGWCLGSTTSQLWELALGYFEGLRSLRLQPKKS